MTPTLEAFREQAGESSLIPLYEQVPRGGLTPLDVYDGVRNTGPSYLLESADPDAKDSRFSILGWDPFLVARIYGDHVDITEGTRRERISTPGDPLPVLRDIARRHRMTPNPALRPFQGGLAGFMGYDLVRKWERLPGMRPPEGDGPEGILVACRRMAVFDHRRDTLTAIVLAPLERGEPVERAFGEAEAALGEILDALRRPRPRSGGVLVSDLRPCTRKADFADMVRRAKDHIVAGDIIQVVLSQKFTGEVSGDPFTLYRALREVNPSPYMFYLQFGDTTLVGASPEVLIRLTGDRIQLCPIAGTRPRGETPEDDMRLERDLLSDPKERAEHIMLVDLGRNDVGRMAQGGSVRVSPLMKVERYSHVMHIVSGVEGRLKKGRDCFDVFMAGFPAGTLSGAPKIRAMEIISALEPAPRGPYGGGVGYFGFDGTMDFCITIRTMTIEKNRLSVQAGAGIVYDSDPEREHQECLNKAAALFRAIERAQGHDSPHR